LQLVPDNSPARSVHELFAPVNPLDLGTFVITGKFQCPGLEQRHQALFSLGALFFVSGLFEQNVDSEIPELLPLFPNHQNLCSLCNLNGMCTGQALRWVTSSKPKYFPATIPIQLCVPPLRRETGYGSGDVDSISCRTVRMFKCECGEQARLEDQGVRRLRRPVSPGSLKVQRSATRLLATAAKSQQGICGSESSLPVQAGFAKKEAANWGGLLDCLFAVTTEAECR
jgi:hypothetical protein